MTRLSKESDKARKRWVAAERRRLGRCTQCGKNRPRDGWDTCRTCAAANHVRDTGRLECRGEWGSTQTSALEAAVNAAA